MVKEIWKHVVGYKGYYEVSSLGRVRSVTRQVQSRFGLRTLEGKMMSLCKDNGYVCVYLRKRNTRVKRWVHDLVIHAFRGARPAGAHVRHRNGDSECNHIGNLLYGTPKSNARDKRRHGTVIEGEAHPRAKVSTAVVLAIRAIPRKALAAYARAAGLDYGWCLKVQQRVRRANG